MLAARCRAIRGMKSFDAELDGHEQASNLGVRSDSNSVAIYTCLLTFIR